MELLARLTVCVPAIVGLPYSSLRVTVYFTLSPATTLLTSVIPNWVVGVAWITVMRPDSIGVRPVCVNLIFICPAIFVLRSVNEAIPPEAALAVVPNNVPGP